MKNLCVNKTIPTGKKKFKEIIYALHQILLLNHKKYYFDPIIFKFSLANYIAAVKIDKVHAWIFCLRYTD